MNDGVEKFRAKLQVLGNVRKNSNLLIELRNEQQVCNEKGSSTRSPKCKNCGSWKEHWIKIAGNKWPLLCSNVDCFNAATVGGHIVFANDKTGRRYIVPLCLSCNGKSSEEFFSITGGTILISANCAETCDKLLN